MGAGGLRASNVAREKWCPLCNWVWGHPVLSGKSAYRAVEALGSRSRPWGCAGSLLRVTQSEGQNLSGIPSVTWE